MLTTNINNFQKDCYNIIEKAIKYNEQVNVVTNKGNAILISEEEYNGLIATLELCKESNFKKQLLQAVNEPLSECVPEDKVNW